MGTTEIVRRDIIDYLITRKKPFEGRLDLLEFLSRIWDLESMPSTDSRFSSAYGDIWQHRINNNDWDDHDFLYGYLELLKCEEAIFFKFLETCLHPIIIPNTEQHDELLTLFNEILKRDNFVLRPTAHISGKPVYKVVPLRGGVQGSVKNLIFAAKGEKPEIVLIDSVNNDIKVVRNEQNCLVYDRPILEHGLQWEELVEWWGKRENLVGQSQIQLERNLYDRLFASLGRYPEKLLFKTYFEWFRESLGNHLPALIPQVYLHYDPYTVRQLANEKRLIRQGMDFLLLFSAHERIVLEVDGQQHYSENNMAKPSLYAEMVAEDRRLRLLGYEIYRFGGYELYGEHGKNVVTDFFHALFRHHSIGKTK